VTIDTSWLSLPDLERVDLMPAIGTISLSIDLEVTRMRRAGFGYLLVHFVEDPDTHSEQIYFSLSDGDDPLRWRRLWGGNPRLASQIGTTGIRDPHIVRRPGGGFYIVATDLRVWLPGGPQWQAFRQFGSRSILVWESPDLLEWSEPRLVEIAPENAGMAWAPEAYFDEESGDFLVHFASCLYGADDLEREHPGPAQILVARTRDFRSFSQAVSYLEMAGGVIDMTVVKDAGRVHRFAKHDDSAPDSWQVFHQSVPGFFSRDPRLHARNIGGDSGFPAEGPLIFRTHDEERWYLWIDEYSRMPQGYRAFTTVDIESGDWVAVPPERFDVPPNTKHGAVLPLQGDEWQKLNELA